MKVFISYCSGVGKELAERLRDKFPENRFNAWTYSEPDYTVSESTWVEIYREISNREVMIVLNMECTQASINQRNEYMRALSIGKKVFAFSERGVDIPAELGSRNIGYFDKDNYDSSCDRLIADLAGLEALASLLQRWKEQLQYKTISTSVEVWGRGAAIRLAPPSCRERGGFSDLSLCTKSSSQHHEFSLMPCCGRA